MGSILFSTILVPIICCAVFGRKGARSILLLPIIPVASAASMFIFHPLVEYYAVGVSRHVLFPDISSIMFAFWPTMGISTLIFTAATWLIVWNIERKKREEEEAARLAAEEEEAARLAEEEGAGSDDEEYDEEFFPSPESDEHPPPDPMYEASSESDAFKTAVFPDALGDDDFQPGFPDALADTAPDADSANEENFE